MQDDEFFDMMYTLWAKTTGAGDSYWRYDDELECDRVAITSVSQDGEEPVAAFVGQHDAEFITAVHGCFGDLIRKLRDLEDENARLDERVDKVEAEMLDLILVNQSLEDDLGRIYDRLDV